ncbi:uncharacterized protein F5147DRAFT_769890 [Suillus discolor]|uniref:Uncharacterized protein n=1 Tax=Suillus discolor TaxID=1912936 RepID=A0A9P7JXK3_9AGAM|nr:uncharacterized protein F5147DRAFT_769890 [Suillus discolor]KAG2114582.1 hypothetical protein F5147DRAFT_769890 [Suillus discolor]
MRGLLGHTDSWDHLIADVSDEHLSCFDRGGADPWNRTQQEIDVVSPSQPVVHRRRHQSLAYVLCCERAITDPPAFPQISIPLAVVYSEIARRLELNSSVNPSAAVTNNQGGLRVGRVLILIAVLVFLILLVTYHWWRPSIPINSFCGCCLPPPRHRSKSNDCANIVVMMSLNHATAAMVGSVADSFWSADAGEVKHVQSAEAPRPDANNTLPFPL